jgi:hypothetical protein
MNAKVVPRKAKLGTVAERTKGISLTAQHLMQFAIQKLAARVDKLERQDALNTLAIKGIRERVQRRDSE